MAFGVDINVPTLPNPLTAITSLLLGNNNPMTGESTATGSLPWAVGASPSPLAPSNSAQPLVNSAFFPYLQPKSYLWDKLVSYRLVVIDTANKNQVVGGKAPSAVTVNPLGNGTLAFTPMSNAWEFFLPITPQQLSITDTYSINTSATLRGVLEEHSGTRFKNIVVQGTFGIWPGRESIVTPPGTPNILQSVFGGTLNALQNVATQFTSIVNNITNGSNASKPVTKRPDNTNPSEAISNPSDPEYNGFGTGYYQTLMLTQFLEQYAEAKRNPANSGWRLVFDIPKQNQSFVVTPVGFTWNENQNRPMEINYNLQLKAWRRINLYDNLTSVPSQVTPLSPGILQQILNTVSAAQNTAAAAYNLIGSVRSDVDNILNIIRQTGLFVKQLSGVATAASDLPAQLTADAQSTISNFISNLNPNTLTGPAATDPTTLAAIANITALNSTNEGLSTANVNNGQLGASSIASATLAPSNAVFTSPLQYPLLFSQVPVTGLALNTAQQNALQTELNNVNEFTVADLKTMRETILSMVLQLETSFGAGDSYYSTLFNTPQPVPTTNTLSPDDYTILQSFYEMLQSYDILTATTQLDTNQILNNMQYVNALAQTSAIEFSIPNSKIQVPVPAGLNIEQIAERYLGDAQLWLEIATLNDLQEPYIDANGFQYSLLSNADGRNIVIDGNQDLFIGQTVYLYANGQTPTARTILNMVTITQTSFLLTLDGLANLDNFTVANQAYLQAYLPGTVNAQNTIWVPSNIAAPAYDQINIPASVSNVDLVGLSKVDWLLTPQGDILVDNMGDFQLAAGLPNLIQALVIKLSTPIGTSLLNPSFGLSVSPGSSVADTTAGDVYNQITNLITADPRFSGVSGLQVSLNGPSVGINLEVQLAGIAGVFPVSFNLPTSQL